MPPEPNGKPLVQNITPPVAEYFIEPSVRTVVHLPTRTYFIYDDDYNLTLLSPKTVAPEIAQGAEDALRQKRYPGFLLKQILYSAMLTLTAFWGPIVALIFAQIIGKAYLHFAMGQPFDLDVSIAASDDIVLMASQISLAIFMGMTLGQKGKYPPADDYAIGGGVAVFLTCLLALVFHRIGTPGFTFLKISTLSVVLYARAIGTPVQKEIHPQLVRTAPLTWTETHNIPISILLAFIATLGLWSATSLGYVVGTLILIGAGYLAIKNYQIRDNPHATIFGENVSYLGFLWGNKSLLVAALLYFLTLDFPGISSSQGGASNFAQQQKLHLFALIQNEPWLVVFLFLVFMLSAVLKQRVTIIDFKSNVPFSKKIGIGLMGVFVFWGLFGIPFWLGSFEIMRAMFVQHPFLTTQDIALLLIIYLAAFIGLLWGAMIGFSLLLYVMFP